MRRQACSYNTAYRAMCGSDHDTAVSFSKTATTQLLPLALLYGKEVFLTNWLRFSILVTFLSSFFFLFFFSRLRLISHSLTVTAKLSMPSLVTKPLVMVRRRCISVLCFKLLCGKMNIERLT